MIVRQQNLTKFSHGATGGAARRPDAHVRRGVNADYTAESYAAETDASAEVGVPALWAGVRDRLRAVLAQGVFETWIAKLDLIAEVDGEILLAAPGEYDRSRIEANYLPQIQKLWSEADGRRRRVRVAARGAIAEDVLSLAQPLPDARVADMHDDAAEPVEIVGETLEADITIEGEQTLDNFVVGESNRVAYGLARRLSLGASVSAQVVTIFGPHGVGKTHLLHGVEAMLVATRGGGHVLYISAEDFMHAFVEGVKRKDTSDLRQTIRRARVVLLDDFQFIYDKPGTLTEFFGHLRAIVANGGVVVLACDTAPSALERLDNRMRDEIQGGVMAHMELPERNLRREIVRAKAAAIATTDAKFAFPEEYVDLLADRLPNSGRSLYGAVRNVYVGTVLSNEPLTRAAVEKAVLLQLGAPSARKPKIDTIKDVTAKAFGITKADLESACRKRLFAQPRQYAMYLSRTLTECSYPQIGRMFGDRDHTTVLFAFRKITRLAASSPQLADDLRQLEQRILADPKNSR